MPGSPRRAQQINTSASQKNKKALSISFHCAIIKPFSCHCLAGVCRLHGLWRSAPCRTIRPRKSENVHPTLGSCGGALFYKFCSNLLNGGIDEDRAPAKQSLLRWPCPLPSDRAIPVLWQNLESNV